MRQSVLTICSILILSINLSAQEYKTVRIKAGTKVQEYFPVSERYLYPAFVPGQVVFKNGKYNNLILNYNILFGEIEFIQAADTLFISKKKDIRFVVAQDTFFYDMGYIEVISGGSIRVGLKQYVKIKEILKEGAFGTTNRFSSVDTYNSMASNGISYDLIPREDIEVQRTLEYYLSGLSGDFLPFTRKNVIQLFPQNEDKIKAYIKSNKIDLDTRDDLLKFADYLRSL